jgi:hypothetical protein
VCISSSSSIRVLSLTWLRERRKARSSHERSSQWICSSEQQHFFVVEDRCGRPVAYPVLVQRVLAAFMPALIGHTKIEPDWPPHSWRLFSALVAAWAGGRGRVTSHASVDRGAARTRGSRGNCTRPDDAGEVRLRVAAPGRLKDLTARYARFQRNPSKIHRPSLGETALYGVITDTKPCAGAIMSDGRRGSQEMSGII